MIIAMRCRKFTPRTATQGTSALTTVFCPPGGPAEASLAEVEASEVIPVYTTRVAGAELGFGARRDGSLPNSCLSATERRSRQHSNFSRLLLSSLA